MIVYIVTGINLQGKSDLEINWMIKNYTNKLLQGKNYEENYKNVKRCREYILYRKLEKSYSYFKRIHKLAVLRSKGFKEIFGENTSLMDSYPIERKIELLEKWQDFLGNTFGFRNNYVPCYLWGKSTEGNKNILTKVEYNCLGKEMNPIVGILNTIEPSWDVCIEDNNSKWLIGDEYTCIRDQIEILGYHRIRLEKPDLFSQYIQRINRES